MLLRKTPLSKKLTSEEIEAKLKEVVCSREPSCFCLIVGISPVFISPVVSIGTKIVLNSGCTIRATSVVVDLGPADCVGVSKSYCYFGSC